MAYQSLYRKYRPQTFNDVVGQQHVTRTLQNALASGRVAHGYLFTGTRGTAKTTVARLLAKALNCEATGAPVMEPCNQCPACKAITGGSSIDVIEMDAASHRGVADIEDVRKSVGYGPMELRYKVFIIDEAHQLSSDAKDAFLKTLEEPPPHVVFILATTEPQAIPITIRSRCQQFDFKRGSLAEISARLKYVLDAEGVTSTPDAVNLVARGAEGSYRDALSLLEQVLAFAPTHISAAEVNAVLGTLDVESLAQVVDAVYHRDAPTAFALAGQLLDAGKEARTLLKTLAAHFRDLLLVQVGGPAVAMELTPEEVGRLQMQARWFTPEQLMKAIDLLNEVQGETRWNNQHRLLVELAFLKLMNLGETPTAPLKTAPIVFAPPSLPTPAPAAPEPEPARVVAFAPDPAPPFAPEKAELPPDFFAGSGGDEEDDFVPGDSGPGLLEEVEDLSVPGITGGTDPLEAEAEDTRSEDTRADDEDDFGGGSGPGEKFPPSEPLPPAPAPAAALPEETPTDSAEKGRSPASEPPAEEKYDGQLDLFNLDDVFRAWAHFLGSMQKVSKATQVVMGRAHPSQVDHGIIEIILPSRFHYDQMADPKRQEIVRKLLARVLNVERVQVRFSLSADVPPPAQPVIEKKREVYNPLAALEALEREADESAGGFRRSEPPGGPPPYERTPASLPPPASPARPATSPPVFAVSSARAPSVRSGNPRPSSAPAVSERTGAMAKEETFDEPTGPLSERVRVAMEDPLVQEVLSIFGGTLIED